VATGTGTCIIYSSTYWQSLHCGIPNFIHHGFTVQLFDTMVISQFKCNWGFSPFSSVFPHVNRT